MARQTEPFYIEPQDVDEYYSVKELIKFVGKLGNNYHKLHESFLQHFEFTYGDEFEQCGDCGEFGTYDCRCGLNEPDYHDAYDDEAAF